MSQFTEKKAETSVPIAELIARRWSPRALDGARPVASETVTALLEAARWAPSCFGDEPWRFVVADRFRDQEAWDAVFGCLSEGNRAWAGQAAVLMVVAADSVFRQNGKPNRWGQYDTGAATENLVLQATALDLVSHQMGGFDQEALRRVLGVPEAFTLMSIVAIGHPGPVEVLPQPRQEQEVAPRRRQPLSAIAFSGSWGEGYGDGAG